MVLVVKLFWRVLESFKMGKCVSSRIPFTITTGLFTITTGLFTNTTADRRSRTLDIAIIELLKVRRLNL